MEGNPQNVFTRQRKNVLMLYDHTHTHVKTIAHYLESFRRYSEFDYSYVTSFASCEFDLAYFDAVVVHFSVRLCHVGHLSYSFARALKSYQGPKVLYLQDEYENTNLTVQAIHDLGFSLVFSVVPAESLAKVYPPEQFPGVRFESILTGYVPLHLEEMAQVKPIAERPILIGYRGRRLGYWYGDLGQEKLVIGQRMKEICDQRGLITDIAWEESDRIYGSWFEFLGNCRATLGTESGANLFDRDGLLALSIQREQYLNPAVTYDEIKARFMHGREGEVRMNQISPKVFEAIALRTALILFEGDYSGVLEPNRHYLPLKKDFSNVDEVLAKLHDTASIEALTERAHADVIRTGRFSYSTFVRQTDAVLAEFLPERSAMAPPWLPLPACDALPSFRDSYERVFRDSALKRVWKLAQLVIRRDQLKKLWVQAPAPLRSICQPVLHLLRAPLK